MVECRGDSCCHKDQPLVVKTSPREQNIFQGKQQRRCLPMQTAEKMSRSCWTQALALAAPASRQANTATHKSTISRLIKGRLKSPSSSRQQKTRQGQKRSSIIKPLITTSIHTWNRKYWRIKIFINFCKQVFASLKGQAPPPDKVIADRKSNVRTSMFLLNKNVETPTNQMHHRHSKTRQGKAKQLVQDARQMAQNKGSH